MTKEETKQKIIQLDVGGTLYKVSRDTLERCEGSMLASLVSKNWKEGNSDDTEPIFIDRNGRLFEYVLDYLRTNKLNLPTSESRAAVQEELEYYGIAAGMKWETDPYGKNFFLEKAEEVKAENRRLDAMNAAKASVQMASKDKQQELLFFTLIEYYRVNPPLGTPVYINFPEEYSMVYRPAWLWSELRNRGFRVTRGKHIDSIRIEREIEEDG